MGGNDVGNFGRAVIATRTTSSYEGGGESRRDIVNCKKSFSVDTYKFAKKWWKQNRLPAKTAEARITTPVQIQHSRVLQGTCLPQKFTFLSERGILLPSKPYTFMQPKKYEYRRSCVTGGALFGGCCTLSRMSILTISVSEEKSVGVRTVKSLLGLGSGGGVGRLLRLSCCNVRRSMVRTFGTGSSLQ